MQTKRKLFLVGVLGIALVLSFALSACEELNYSVPGVDFDSEMPVIKDQPVGGSFTIGTNDAVLTVVVSEVGDGGTVTYQWYDATNTDAGVPISGARAASYTITAEGVYRIFVRVTNTASGAKPASVNSEVILVTVNDPNNAQYPNITTEPKSTAYELTSIATDFEALSVTASVTDDGVLSYQWYSLELETDSSTVWIPISGATSATYKPTTQNAVGTWYYYVVVTNTWADAPGRKTSTTTSTTAVIKAVRFNATITVATDGANKKQYVRGFGGMAVFWSNSPQDSKNDYERMFNPNSGLGYNMLRVMIPVDGTNMRTTMNKAVGNELSGARDRSHYYDIVKIVNKYGGYVLASPWSPPPQWKSNGSVNGGAGGSEATLLKEYWDSYADYLRLYCQIMNEKGAPIYAVSIQNEYNYPASYDGCEWSDNDLRDFFLQVGKFTNIPTPIPGYGKGVATDRVLIMTGETANTTAGYDVSLNNANAVQNFDLIGRHIYGNATETVSALAQSKGKEVWMTEYNLNSGAGSYESDSTYPYMWTFLNTIDLSLRLNGENAFIWWYLKRFYSMMGDGDYGTYDGQLLPRGYALSHFAKYAKETYFASLSVSGTDNAGTAINAGSDFNNTTYNVDSTAVRALAFVSEDGDSISLVLFTPTNKGGIGGRNMGNIKIQFPADFKATKVSAMRTSSSSAMGVTDNESILSKDGNAAYINLPAAQILSVKFTK